MTDSSDAIQSERLDLQRLQVADADEMVAVLNDPRLYEFIGGAPPTATALRERYLRLSEGRSEDRTEAWRNWIVRIRADGATIGTVQATIVDSGRRAAIAWVIGMPWQGRGYATEAAAALVDWLIDRGVRSIDAAIHPAHAASATVARRIGLEPTDEQVDGERVWRLAAPNRSADSPTPTDESR